MKARDTFKALHWKLSVAMESVILLICFAIIAVVIVGMWKVFEKADEPGWAPFIPLYNTWVMIRISNNPWWFFVLMFVPLIQLYPSIKVQYDIGKQFGQGVGFGIGLILFPFIFYPILGFGDYQYENAELNQ